MENLISTSDLASMAPDLDTSAYSATATSGIISRASAAVINYCGVKGFLTAAETNERDRALINSAGDLIISFRRRPVAQGAISAIRLRTVDVNQSLTLTSGGSDIYFIPYPGNYVSYPSNYLLSAGAGLLPLRSANLFYEIDYTGGEAIVPYDVQEATVLMIRSILSKQYNPAGASSFSQGSMSIQQIGIDGVDQFTKQARNLLDAGGYVRRVP